jgi:hypothetical protein
MDPGTIDRGFTVFISVLFVLAFEMEGSDYSGSELSSTESEPMNFSDLSDSEEREV